MTATGPETPGRCARCGKPSDCISDHGVLLCADCMFDEAEPGREPSTVQPREGTK